MAENTNAVFDWDDKIEDDGNSQDWVLLPAGEYEFTVEELEKSWFDGSDNLPPCNMAVLTLKVKHPDGTTNRVWDRLFLVKKMEWKLSSFFRSIGVKQHGSSVTMDWNAVEGATGRCKIVIDTYNGSKSNKVKSYLDPVATKPKLEAGVF